MPTRIRETRRKQKHKEVSKTNLKIKIIKQYNNIRLKNEHKLRKWRKLKEKKTNKKDKLYIFKIHSYIYIWINKKYILNWITKCTSIFN